jgi:hypothetical protein
MLIWKSHDYIGSRTDFSRNRLHILNAGARTDGGEQTDAGDWQSEILSEFLARALRKWVSIVLLISSVSCQRDVVGNPALTASLYCASNRHIDSGANQLVTAEVGVCFAGSARTRECQNIHTELSDPTHPIHFRVSTAHS